jgi:hypothetical protein
MSGDIPEPQPGQVWQTPKRYGLRWVVNYDETVLYRVRLPLAKLEVELETSRGEWFAWAKRTGARPVESAS